MSLRLALPLLLVAAPARAEVQALASVGYATEIRAVTDDATSAYRIGVGARGGVTLRRLYLGVAAHHHLGTSERARNAAIAYESVQRTTVLAAEVGYDAPVSSRLTLRPYLGVGAYYAYARATVGGARNVEDHWGPQATPGLLALLALDHLRVGADLRVVCAPFRDPPRWAPGLFVSAGYAF